MEQESTAHQEFVKKDFILSTDKSKLQIDVVCDFLWQSHWAANRKKETVIKSIENSLCYGVYHNDLQVAFARLVTDFATFAYLCDVFVDKKYRGIGISKWMMTAIMKNPMTSNLRRFMLATKDASSLYEKFGFKIFTPEEHRIWMSIFNENT